MMRIDTVVVGAGHAGLAVSRMLAAADREHVVLERGRIGERWRSERWDSLHLLTPNWMTRLPGARLGGTDDDGYLRGEQFVELLEKYAGSFTAPVVEQTSVERLDHAPGAADHPYEVVTDRGVWRARHIVIATGPYDVASVPSAVPAGGLGALELVTSQQYRNPEQLPSGGVLVVGASAAGVQIADELARAGRDVVLAVGRHTRMPRRYRGMDIFWWLESTGRLGRTVDEVPDVAAARRETSMQLVGHNHPARFGASLDLADLQGRGVRVAGRLDALSAERAVFRDDLAATVATAEARMHRFLDAADRHAHRSGLDPELDPAIRPAAVPLPATPTTLDLRSEGIGTVLLATGYRSHRPWLRLPIVSADGSIRQYRGATPLPGVFVVGQRFQHRRDSGFIDGARHNAAMVVQALLATPHTGTARPEQRWAA